MTPEERAERLLVEGRTEYGNLALDVLAAAIREAEQAARRQALEEAARLLDLWDPTPRDVLAARIRSLAEQTHTEGGG